MRCLFSVHLDPVGLICWTFCFRATCSDALSSFISTVFFYDVHVCIFFGGHVLMRFDHSNSAIFIPSLITVLSGFPRVNPFGLWISADLGRTDFKNIEKNQNLWFTAILLNMFKSILNWKSILSINVYFCYGLTPIGINSNLLNHALLKIHVSDVKHLGTWSAIRKIQCSDIDTIESEVCHGF